MPETFSDDTGYELLPVEDTDLIAASDQLEAAQASLIDGVSAETPSEEAPIPFGRSWLWDQASERYVRAPVSSRRTGRDELVTACFAEAEPYYLLGPGPDGDLTPMGSAKAPDAVPMNGAPLVSPGLIDGADAVSLNGTSQFINTGVLTRTNGFTNPLVASVAGFTATGTGTTRTMEVGALPVELGGGEGGILKIVTINASAGVRASTAMTVTPSTNNAVGCFFKGEVGVSYLLCLREEKGAGELIAEKNTAVVATGAWQWISFYIACGAECTSIKWAFRTSATPTASTFFVTGVMMEPGRMVIAKAEYFPTAAQLTAGICGWSGTASESASDSGPFARGTKRTYFAVIELTGTQTHGIFGTSAAGTHSGIFVTSAGALTFRLSDGTTPSDKTAVAAGSILPGERHIVTVVWDGIANTYSGYLDGVKKTNAVSSTTAHVDTNMPLAIGLLNEGTRFKGRILPALIMAAKLTDAEVLALTEAALTEPEPIGGAPIETRGTDTLRQWMFAALHTAQGAHPVFPPSFGIEDPDDWIGGVDPTDALSTFEPRANDALTQHDRVEEVDDITAEYDPDEGVISIEDLVVITDEQEAVPLTEVELTPNY